MAKTYTHGWRLGLDVGSDSLGWAAFRLGASGEPDKLLDGGVRLFDGGRDPKTKVSYAKGRGLARRARRRLRARNWRREKLKEALRAAGLSPPNEPVIDIWGARERAATAPIDAALLGAVILFIARHRGFKSPRLGRPEAPPVEAKIRKGRRKSPKTDDNAETRKEFPEVSGDKQEDDIHRWARAEEILRGRMKETGAPTIGALLANDLHTKGYVRARRGHENHPVPTRPLLAEELEVIRRVQSGHLRIDPDRWRVIVEFALEQRPLREARPGRCTFFPEDERMPKCLPTAQRFRIRQTLCNLRVTEGIVGETRPLTAEQFSIIDEILSKGGTHSWPSLRAAIDLPKRGVKFTIEIERKAGESKRSAKEIDGDETATIFSALVPGWFDLAILDRDSLTGRFRKAQRKRRDLVALAEEIGVPADKREEFADAVQFNLPRGYLSLGERAIAAILPHLAAGTSTYDKAVERGLGRSHSDLGPAEILAELPYYGEVLRRGVLPCNDGPDHERRTGRVGNVTVHIALNEVRKVVNALIARHGRPAMVVVETTRELKADAERLRQIDKEQSEREKENQEFEKDYGDSLSASGRMGKGKGRKMAVGLHEARKRVRLARRQGNICPYTEKEIGRADLFTEAYDIDHIVPRDIGGNGFDNLVLCVAGANRSKRDRTPWEAFREDREIWPHIENLLKKLPEAMRWRFGPEARKIAEGEGEDGGWAPRQIRDTSYIARMAREYLTHICKDVWTTKGRLTGLLRSAWDLPVARIKMKDRDGIERDIPKKRLDHRHHFVDAVVIAVTGRSAVQRINTLAARGELKRAYEADIPFPYPNFVEEVQKRCDRIWPSIRPDHSEKHPSGALHKETLYGVKTVGEKLVKRTERIGIVDLFKKDGKFRPDSQVEAAIKSFVSDQFRDRFRKVMANHREGSSCPAETAIKAAADPHWGPRGIGEIKCWKDDKAKPEDSIKKIPRTDKVDPDPVKDSKKFAAIDTNANAWLSIRRAGKKWRSSTVTKFDAAKMESNQGAGTDIVMVLHNGDILGWDNNGKPEYGWLKVIKSTEDRFFVWPLRLSTAIEAVDLRPDLRIPVRRKEGAERSKGRSDGLSFSSETFRKAKGRQCTITVLGRLRDPGPSKE